MTVQPTPMKQGAALVRRVSPTNPMEVLSRLRNNDGAASFDHQFKKWKKIIEANSDLLDATLLHAFQNYWTALDRAATKQRAPMPIRATEATVERVRNFILMDLVLPHGKALRDSTFLECRQAGGWFKEVSRLGKPQQIVGKTVSEERLQKIAAPW